MNSIRIACIALIASFSIASAALSVEKEIEEADALSQDDKDRIEFLLSSMKKSRQEMAIGQCTVDFTNFRKRENWVEQDTESIECAFDFPAQNYAMRRRFRRVDGKYLSTPQRSFVHTRGKIVSVHHPMEVPALVFRPFDVRVLGWASPHGFDSNLMAFEKLFATYMMQDHWHDVKKDAAGVYKVVFRVMKPHPVEQILWLDSAKGYVPVRFESGYVEPKTGKWNTPKDIVETKWKKRGGAWFPEAVTFTSIQHKGTPKEIQDKRVMTFHWKSANQPLDGSLFALKSWNLPPDSLAVDVRPGTENVVSLGRIDSLPEYSVED